jgi:uncharacterized protein
MRTALGGIFRVGAYSVPTELFEAIAHHEAKRVALILSRGADPNALDTETPWRPLEAVIEEGIHYDAPKPVVNDIVRKLIQHGADVNFWYDGRKLTPLLAAISWPNRELAGILLDAGADANIVNEDDCTPLIIAVRDSDLELAASLLRHGATKTINKYSVLWNRGALHIAVEELNVPMVELLLESGADAQAQTDDGDTPLSFLPPWDKLNAERWDAVVRLIKTHSSKPN